MLDVNDLVEGVTKVRILDVPQYVTQDVGDIGEFIKICEITDWSLVVKFGEQFWYFRPEHLEIVESEDNLVKSSNQSEDLIIYKSRWDEIVESLEGRYGMTDEEAEIVKSVLKNNVPYSVVNDPVIVDPIIEKGEQTHLDATHIGGEGNAGFYYNSKVLGKLFWWNIAYEWQVCGFKLEDVTDIYPITISK